MTRENGEIRKRGTTSKATAKPDNKTDASVSSADQQDSLLQVTKLLVENFASSVAVVFVDLFWFLVELPYMLWMVVVALLLAIVEIATPRMRKCVDGETLLVTGAAAGLGQEAVFELARTSPSATYVLWDINAQGLEETRLQLQKVGATRVYCYVVDLSKYESVVEMASLVKKEVGPITLLFNNAGLVHFNPFLAANPAMEQKIIEVNLLSYMWTIRQFLPDMIQAGRGHIVNTCSGLGHLRFRYLSAYVASKFGLRGFLETLKLELRCHPDQPDIRFSTVYPGWVKTNMTTGISWTPRYKSWQFTRQLEPAYFARRMVDGILREEEEIMIPGSLRFLAHAHNLLPTSLCDRFENWLLGDIQIVEASTNVQENATAITIMTPDASTQGENKLSSSTTNHGAAAPSPLQLVVTTTTMPQPDNNNSSI